MFCPSCKKVYRSCVCGNKFSIPSVSTQIKAELILENTADNKVIWKGPLVEPCVKCKKPMLHFRVIYSFRADEGNIIITKCFNCTDEASHFK